MRKMKQWKGLILVLVCLILVLGACSSNNSNKPANTPGASNSSPGNKEGSDQPATTNPFEKKMTISMFNGGTWGADALPPRNDDEQRIMLEEAVNIDLQMTIPPVGETDAKLNSLLASGQTPDIMFFNDRAQAIKFYEEGLLIPIDEYLNNFPKLKEFFTEDQWGALKHKGATIGTPGLELVSGINGWWIRKDWLDQLKLPIPTTTEELLDVMKAFTYNDPDQNGQNDTYGFFAGVPKDGNIANPSLKLGLDAVMWLFGVNPHKIDIVNGELVYHNTDPRMKEAVTFINRMVNEKLIDPDWVTTSDAGPRGDKINRGKLGVIVGDWRMMDNPTKMIEISGDADWVSIPPVKGPDGKQILGELAFQSNLWGISANAAKEPGKVERILALLEYWYTDKEAYPYFAYGTKGVFWDYGSNKEIIRHRPEQEVISQYGWNTHYKLNRGAHDALYYNFNKLEFTGAAHQTNLDHSIPPLPSVYLVPKESDTLYEDRMKYVNETLLKFIYGSEPISNWDKYVSTLESTYKLQEYLAGAMEQFKEQGLLN
ncbi:extracellular solute-binding protein [Paenibacillus sp. GXUN7292]|uniref:extracellular solute-binding protein n=1 Tax=Paenibacillus sp. GXUN7292 TaxID=3422499 RepID=UPI003D7E1BDC